MAGYATAFGRGLILGAGAALLYAAARDSLAPARAITAQDRQRAEDQNRLIDWDWATRIAIRTAGRTWSLHPGATAQLKAEYEAMLRDIEGPIATYTGNDLSLGTRASSARRPGWSAPKYCQFPRPSRPSGFYPRYGLALPVQPSRPLPARARLDALASGRTVGYPPCVVSAIRNRPARP